MKNGIDWRAIYTYIRYNERREAEGIKGEGRGKGRGHERKEGRKEGMRGVSVRKRDWKLGSNEKEIRDRR